MSGTEKKDLGEKVDVLTQQVLINDLFEREPDSEYIQECTELLMKQKKEGPAFDEITCVVFRLSDEWLALSVGVLSEISDIKIVHKVPHRASQVLTGIVNLRGTLRANLDLHELLGIRPIDAAHKAQGLHVYPRLLAVQGSDTLFTFAVDEVAGVYKFSKEAITSLPVTVAKTKTNYFKAVIEAKDKNIGLLDEELLLYSMHRSLL